MVPTVILHCFDRVWNLKRLPHYYTSIHPEREGPYPLFPRVIPERKRRGHETHLREIVRYLETHLREASLINFYELSKSRTLFP